MMKIKLALLLGLPVLALSMLACTTTASNTSVNVPISDFSKQNNISREIQVMAGDTFTVTLGSNPTTGFSWAESAKISDPQVLQQTEHRFVAPEESRPGAPGEEVWTFRALQAGKAVISLDYSRPWEGGEKGVWTFTLAVTVQ